MAAQAIVTRGSTSTRERIGASWCVSIVNGAMSTIVHTSLTERAAVDLADRINRTLAG
jgi:hypothetical protein